MKIWSLIRFVLMFYSMHSTDTTYYLTMINIMKIRLNSLIQLYQTRAQLEENDQKGGKNITLYQ